MSRHPDYDDILAKYLKKGRIASWPRSTERRAVLLDFLAQHFEPGEHYSEAQVNAIVGRFHNDFAMMRRHLVDMGFMDRDHGVYWRAGGTWEIE